MSITLILIVVALLSLYCMVKIANMILKTFAKHPKNKALWISLSIFVVCSLLIVLTRNPVFIIFASLSMTGFVVTVRIVDLYYTELFEDNAPMLEKVLRKPWWEGTQDQISA
jgi:hypothetical protein